jgi:hypothetical protein
MRFHQEGSGQVSSMAEDEFQNRQELVEWKHRFANVLVPTSSMDEEFRRSQIGSHARL